MHRWVVLLLFVVASGCHISQTPVQTVQPPVPQIVFLFPTSGTVVVMGTDVQIQLLAQDRSGVGVARVELYVDEALHQQSSPVVSAAVTDFTVDMNWLAEGVGLHSFRAVALRPDGTSSDPAIITLEVIAAGDSEPTPNP